MIDKATRNSWTNIKMKSFYEINLNYVFTEQDYCNMNNGIIPKEMEDKWFIFSEDNIVYFHRSWTGICVYELVLNKFTNRHIIRVNADINEYISESDDKEIEKLKNLIRYINNQYDIYISESSNALN